MSTSARSATFDNPRRRGPTTPPVDVLGLVLGLWQATMIAYLVFAVTYDTVYGFGLPLEVDFASGPSFSRFALAYWWGGSVVMWVIAALAALAAATRSGGLSYPTYVWVCAVNFCLTVASYTVLAPWTTYVHTGPQLLSVTPVCVDRGWPVVAVPAFLFCNPVLILLAVRTVRGGTARASPAPGG